MTNPTTSPTMPGAPPPLDLVRILSALTEDAFFTIVSTAKLDGEALSALTQRRMPVFVAAARGQATPGLQAWEAWVLDLATALSAISPPRWIPFADSIEDGVSLGHGARGMRSLFTSKPSDKDVARVRAVGAMALRSVTSVLAAKGPLNAEATLLRKALLASFALPEPDRAELEAEAPLDPESLGLQGDVDRKIARSIVRASFYAARLDGTDPREEQAVIVIARKLGLTTDELDEAREEARATMDAGKDFGEACVEGIRWLLAADPAKVFANAAARLALAPIQRHDAIAAINIGGQVTLQRRHKLDRRSREAALGATWIAAMHANPSYLWRALLVDHHDRQAADLGDEADGAAVRAKLDRWIEVELAAIIKACAA